MINMAMVRFLLMESGLKEILVVKIKIDRLTYF